MTGMCHPSTKSREIVTKRNSNYLFFTLLEKEKFCYYYLRTINFKDD